MIGKFDPLLGRLRTEDTKTIEKTERITNRVSGGASQQVSVGLTLPATGVDGDVFYDTDDATLYVWANGMWNAISGGGGVAPGGSFDFVDETEYEFIDGTYFDFIT